MSAANMATEIEDTTTAGHTEDTTPAAHTEDSTSSAHTEDTTPPADKPTESEDTTPAAVSKDATPAANKKFKGRRLIVLCDGTWQNSYRDGGKSPTNVTRLARAIKSVAEDGTSQICFYMPGVGATTPSPIMRQLEGAFGTGFFDMMRQAYGFLAYNYQEGDTIYFFGFSRGSYLVRAVCGLITECGLLTREGMSRFVELLQRYQERILDNDKKSQPKTYLLELVMELREKEILRMDPIISPGKVELGNGFKVEAIGCFDTVGALDIISNSYSFVNVTYNSQVKRAYHALALDEDRKPFGPTLWFFNKENLEGDSNFKQVWFTGVHSNIGGGSSSKILGGTDYLASSSSDANSLNVLSDGPLIWMVAQVQDILDFDYLYLHTTIMAGKTKIDKSGNTKSGKFGVLLRIESTTTSPYDNRDGYRTEELNRRIASALEAPMKEMKKKKLLKENHRKFLEDELRELESRALKPRSSMSQAWYRGPLYDNYPCFFSSILYSRQPRSVKGYDPPDMRKTTNKFLHESVFQRGAIVKQERKSDKQWWQIEHEKPLKNVYWTEELHGTDAKAKKGDEKKIEAELYSEFELEFWVIQRQTEVNLISGNQASSSGGLSPSSEETMSSSGSSLPERPKKRPKKGPKESPKGPKKGPKSTSEDPEAISAPPA